METINKKLKLKNSIGSLNKENVLKKMKLDLNGEMQSNSIVNSYINTLHLLLDRFLFLGTTLTTTTKQRSITGTSSLFILFSFS